MQVADLANVFPTETMEAGTVLFEQGGTDGDGFIVQVGKVELSREVGGSVQRGIFVGAGEILGVVLGPGVPVVLVLAIPISPTPK